MPPSMTDPLASGRLLLLAPVNAVGVPGAGLALTLARAFPFWVEPYRARCSSARGGDLFLVRGPSSVDVLCAFTKEDWRKPSELRWIQGICLKAQRMDLSGYAEVRVPALGCGLGGLSFERVGPILIAGFGHGKSRFFPPQ